jgi:hypothetical protein
MMRSGLFMASPDDSGPLGASIVTRTISPPPGRQEWRHGPIGAWKWEWRLSGRSHLCEQ